MGDRTGDGAGSRRVESNSTTSSLKIFYACYTVHKSATGWIQTWVTHWRANLLTNLNSRDTSNNHSAPWIEFLIRAHTLTKQVLFSAHLMRLIKRKETFWTSRVSKKEKQWSIYLIEHPASIKHGGVFVMLWGFFASSRSLRCMEGKIDSIKYQNSIENRRWDQRRPWENKNSSELEAIAHE